MGSSGTKEVELTLDGDDFIQTGDGVKLSPSLLKTMGANSEQIINKEILSQEKGKIAREYQVLLDEREKEISRLVEKGKEDLENEREKHEKLYQLTIEEFNKSADDVEQKFLKSTLKPICGKLQASLLECYKNNPKAILDCSEDLKNFRDCIDNTKDSLLKNKIAD